MKKLVRVIISIILSLILVYFLFTRINVKDIGQTISMANKPLLVLSFTFYFMVMVFRVYRFNTLLKNKIKKTVLMPIVLFHSLLVSIVPLKLGELSYVYFLKKEKLPAGKGLSSLLVARLFDFSILMVGLLITIIISNNIPNKESFIQVIPLLLLGVILLVFLLFFMIFLHDKFIKIVSNISKLVKFLPFKETINAFLKSFKSYKSNKLLLSTFISSVFIFICKVMSSYLLIISLGFFIPIDVGVIIISFSILSSLLPINGIANFGTMETVWTIILTFFGYSLESAILLAFSLHIIQLCFALILGIFGWIKLNLFS